MASESMAMSRPASISSAGGSSAVPSRRTLLCKTGRIRVEALGFKGLRAKLVGLGRPGSENLGLHAVDMGFVAGILYRTR